MSRWFRMYNEVLDDPKVQRLNGDDFKAWVNLLCLASRLDGALPPLEDIGFALRMDGKKAKAVVARLVSAGLLDEEEGRFRPHSWNDRQYQSDVSTGRVKQFRERKKIASRNGDETFHETAPDTETDTEVTLAKANGVVSLFPDTPQKAPATDSDSEFWSSAKAYLADETKNPGALIGKWSRDNTKQTTAQAITRAQLERPVQKIPFIEGCFRQMKQTASAQPAVPL